MTLELSFIIAYNLEFIMDINVIMYKFVSKPRSIQKDKKDH